MGNKFLRNIIYKANMVDVTTHNINCAIRRQYMEDKILNCIDSGVTLEKYCDAEIVVSLTSYGKRLNSVCYAIESIMQQTKKANRIVLWLGEKDFDGIIPAALEKQKKRGLEIRRTKDIRSFTKIIPALKEFPNAAIVTIDDDIIYDFDVLSNIIESYLTNPQCIHAFRFHVIKYDSNGKMKPYNKWDWCSFDVHNNKNNFFTGVGGVLYPPKCFDSEIFNENVFLEICKTADDVWLNAMARKSGIRMCKAFGRNQHGENYYELSEVQDVALRNSNVAECLNDKQLHSVWAKYSLYN